MTKLKTMLEQLEENRVDFVHLNREPPYIVLTRKGRDAGRQTVQLLDVGSDFIEVGLTLAELGRNTTSQFVSRDQIAEVQWIGKGN